MNHSLNTVALSGSHALPCKFLRICEIVIFVMSPVDSLFFLQFLSYLCTQNLEKLHERFQE